MLSVPIILIAVIVIVSLIIIGTKMQTNFKKIIRNVYLYTFSAVGMIIFLVGGVGLINVFLKTYVFPLEHYSEYYYTSCSDPYVLKETPDFDVTACEASQEEERATQDSDARKRDLASGLAAVVCGTPIWLYHWRVIQKSKNIEE